MHIARRAHVWAFIKHSYIFARAHASKNVTRVNADEAGSHKPRGRQIIIKLQLAIVRTPSDRGSASKLLPWRFAIHPRFKSTLGFSLDAALSSSLSFSIHSRSIFLPGTMFFSLPLPFFISLSPFLSLLPRVLARAVRVRGGDRFIPVRCNGVKVDACYARFYPRPAHAHSRKSDRIDEPRRKKFQRLFLNFIPPCGQPEPDFGSRVDFARVSPLVSCVSRDTEESFVILDVFVVSSVRSCTTRAARFSNLQRLKL